ncbi:MAG TPA: DUF2523 family protein [Xanthomonadaceae bacterium]
MIKFESELVGGIAAMLDKLVKAKVALWFGRILTALGLGFAAQQFIYEPLIDQAIGYWHAVPATLAAWVHALGIDTGASIILSAYGIRGVERIFLARRDNTP